MKSKSIQQWWPLGQSLDIVRGNAETVSKAVVEEIQRFIDPEPLCISEMAFGSIDRVFGSVPVFTNFPTTFFILPTRSGWAVLWNNSFLCDGYDSLCYCLTVNHGFDTLHWTAHDDDTTFQAGSSFTFRSQLDGVLKERSVYVGKNDGVWTYFESGQALSEEDLSSYEVRRKRDRLNEGLLMELLFRLGAKPWVDEWYDFGSQCIRLIRKNYPETIIERPVGEVIARGV